MTSTTTPGGADLAKLKSSVKNYFALEKELKNSAVLMTKMRKKRRACETEILEWMVRNNKVRISNKDGVIKRITRKRKTPVNKDYMEKRAAEYFNGDKQKAEEIREFIFNNRPVEDKETLKCCAPETGDSIQV